MYLPVLCTHDAVVPQSVNCVLEDARVDEITADHHSSASFAGFTVHTGYVFLHLRLV